jgi:hypothetical protein
MIYLLEGTFSKKQGGGGRRKIIFFSIWGVQKSKFQSDHKKIKITKIKIKKFKL